MARKTYPASFPASEFEVIETALMETARGRWFLAEYARQNRTADTELLLDAIARLESSLTEPSVPPELDRIRMDLMEMSETIARARQEIASVDGDESALVAILAADVLETIVTASEKGAADTLSAAEQVQEAAWRLRQTETGAEVCDELDQLATSIHDAGSLQDINRQRTHKLIDALRYLESRVNRMINVWGLDDIEVIQKEDDQCGRAETPMLQGQAEVVDVYANPVDDRDMQSDQPPEQFAVSDVGFAKDDEPVDLEALPRVAPYDVDTEDANSPEMDIICVDDLMLETAAQESAAESEREDVGTEPIAETAPTAPTVEANDPAVPPAAFLEDDHDLFESEELPAAPVAQQVEQEAPAPEQADLDSEDTKLSGACVTPAAAPVTEETAPASQVGTETDASAVRSTAERINRLTPDERIALFS